MRDACSPASPRSPSPFRKIDPRMIETIHPGASAPDARVAIFDFDGTLSLIRTGWVSVMAPMMVEILSALGSGETPEQLRAVVDEYVWRLTGKETVYQMIALADEIQRRGGTPLDPLAYKRQYLDRLANVIGGRLQELRERRCPPDKYLVPGARSMLEAF